MLPRPATLCAVLALAAAPAAAEIAFLRPPPPGSTAPRITIRVHPTPPLAASAEEAADPEPWPPDLAADPPTTPARLDAATVALDGAAPAPALADLDRIARAHGAAIARATVGTRVPPALALALIAVESSGRADAVSPAGAAGLMQLIPATAARFGVRDGFDPDDNIRGGVAYLDWLLGEFDGDAVLALAGYNAGEGAVRRHGGVPPYRETRLYVPKVAAAWAVARLVCADPPAPPTDACAARPALLRAAGAAAPAGVPARWVAPTTVGGEGG